MKEILFDFEIKNSSIEYTLDDEKLQVLIGNDLMMRLQTMLDLQSFKFIIGEFEQQIFSTNDFGIAREDLVMRSE